ncbi:uncharacterized protein LOC122880155 isoform X1 [Siniperca chuatsi]|uniref:uncharacterized protein LOC122880155 isoform X1 n=1 Tax=Siniperca chuatsi TaxID=119488 RepID=UPI001CE13F3C|nr:uncharacterized protein LOC122880155 isoform X1 [Siniperca chuatsi]XP_044060928.1 uncharacterized protein LOC122880155 isoform X1 [Siniperca chuatsi]XP_044060929.1 uncharacterized protein LOC122880155 isoform X1 [Siniperca chuatsi]
MCSPSKDEWQICEDSRSFRNTPDGKQDTWECLGPWTRRCEEAAGWIKTSDSASAGAVERENSSLKNKLAKCCDETGLPWTKALPIVLMYMRSRIRSRGGLNPFEILFGRPLNTGIGPVKRQLPDTSQCEDEMLRYCTNLSSVLSNIHKQVKEAIPRAAERKLHDLEPGDWIVAKDFRRKNWRARKWNGPYQILLTTETAVKVAEKATWIHATHCKRVPEPGPEASHQTNEIEISE